MAQANDQYVTSLYRHNVAKLSLARALGSRRRTTRTIWEESNVADTTQQQTSAGTETEESRSRPIAPQRHCHRGGGRCWLLVGLGFWWRSTYTEDTDDAQVNGHLIQVSARIAGQVHQGRRG